MTEQSMVKRKESLVERETTWEAANEARSMLAGLFQVGQSYNLIGPKVLLEGGE